MSTRYEDCERCQERYHDGDIAGYMVETDTGWRCRDQCRVNDDATYKIVRFYAPHLKRENETIETGLTLEKAQEHCQRKDTHEPGEWFDGYTEE